jgi:hypothetical protein
LGSLIADRASGGSDIISCDSFNWNLRVINKLDPLGFRGYCNFIWNNRPCSCIVAGIVETNRVWKEVNWQVALEREHVQRIWCTNGVVPHLVSPFLVLFQVIFLGLANG